jgi:energy-coupling factor transporter transmembrane protein EcfT
VAIVSSAPLARLNPVTKIALALVLSVALVLTVDLVTAGIVLAAELLALPLAGLGARALLLRAGPLAVLAVSVTVLNALVSDRSRSASRPPSPVSLRGCAWSRSPFPASSCSPPPTRPSSPTRSPSGCGCRTGSCSVRWPRSGCSPSSARNGGRWPGRGAPAGCVPAVRRGPL